MKRGISVVAVACVLSSAGLWVGASVAWANSYNPGPPTDTYIYFLPTHEGEPGDDIYIDSSSGYTNGSSCWGSYAIGVYSDDSSLSEVDVPAMEVLSERQRSWVWCGDPSDAPGCHYKVTHGGNGQAHVWGDTDKDPDAGDVLSAGGGTSGGYGVGGGLSTHANVGVMGSCNHSGYSGVVSGEGYGTDLNTGGADFYDVKGHWSISQTSSTLILEKGATTINVHGGCWCWPGAVTVLAIGGTNASASANCYVQVSAVMSVSVSIISMP